MDLKRLLALGLILSLTLFGACGSKPDGTETEKKKNSSDAPEGTSLAADGQDATPETQVPAAEPPTTLPLDRIRAPEDPESGRTFAVDLTNVGTLRTDAPALGSFAFMLNGKTYTLPVTGRYFMNEGFSHDLSAKDNSFQAGKVTSIIGNVYMKTVIDGKEETCFAVRFLKNTAGTDQGLENCLIVGIELRASSAADWVLPGGVCRDSTAANVLQLHGMPDSPAAPFTAEASFNEFGLTYQTPESLRVQYYFDEDGSISRVCIDTAYARN